MGATPSKEEPAAKRDVLRADVDQGFFSSLWLCGGGDAVDDKAIEKVRKHNDRSGDIRTARVNDAARVTESADLFVREFKQTMRERGFAGFKYNRNGRSAPRIFLLDTNEQMARRGAGRATRRPARRAAASSSTCGTSCSGRWRRTSAFICCSARRATRTRGATPCSAASCP